VQKATLAYFRGKFLDSIVPATLEGQACAEFRQVSSQKVTSQRSLTYDKAREKFGETGQQFCGVPQNWKGTCMGWTTGALFGEYMFKVGVRVISMVRTATHGSPCLPYVLCTCRACIHPLEQQVSDRCIPFVD